MGTESLSLISSKISNEGRGYYYGGKKSPIEDIMIIFVFVIQSCRLKVSRLN